nr:LEF-1 [Darna trima granulovirus]
MNYTKEQLLKVWNGVAYREDRYWAFCLPNNTWRHTDSKWSNKKTFDDFNQFENYVRSVQAQDIHVKTIVDGTREWVIDVDHNETDYDRIKLKNMIAHAMFSRFYAHNCTRILYSGNRGLHIWLNTQDFDRKASKEVRSNYYKSMFPKDINKNNSMFVQEHSLNDCFNKTFDNVWIRREITRLYPNINLDDANELITEFYPNVDEHIFISLKQIRAPYSYNSKGKKYSCDHELLLE